MKRSYSWVRGYVSILRNPKFYTGEKYPPAVWKIRISSPYFVSGPCPKSNIKGTHEKRKGA